MHHAREWTLNREALCVQQLLHGPGMVGHIDIDRRRDVLQRLLEQRERGALVSRDERPDLLQAFSGDLASVSRAGFCCVCRGDVRIDDLRDPMLKIVFEDGSSEIHAIDVGIIHRLGHAIRVKV